MMTLYFVSEWIADTNRSPWGESAGIWHGQEQWSQ